MNNNITKEFWKKLGKKLGIKASKIDTFCIKRSLEWGKVQIYYDIFKRGGEPILKTKVRLPVNYASIPEKGLKELLCANTALSSQIGVSVCIYDKKDVVLVDFFGSRNIEKIVEITMVSSAAAIQICIDIEKHKVGIKQV